MSDWENGRGWLIQRMAVYLGLLVSARDELRKDADPDVDRRELLKAINAELDKP